MVEEQTEKIIEKEKEQSQEQTEKMWKIVAIVVAIFATILLIIWASSSENFKLFPFIGTIVVVILFFVGAFWGVGWWRELEELRKGKVQEGKLPPAITIEQARILIKEQMQDPTYCDIVQSWKQHRVYNVGKGQKNRILCVQLDTIYNTCPNQFFIINLHYPKELWTYICQEKYNTGEIIRLVNSLSVHPEEDPDERETVTENVLTGNRVMTKEKIQQREKDKEKEKKGDLE